MSSFCAIAAFVLFSSSSGVLADWQNPSTRGSNCDQGIDMVFLQDTTETLSDDLPSIVAQIEGTLSAIEAEFKYSRFAVAEFRDKPIYPLGFPGYDFCYDLGTPLTSNHTVIKNAFRSFVAGGGADLKEASYHAIWNAANDVKMGYRPFSSDTEIDPTKSAARIFVLITDAQPHMAGNTNMPAFPGTSSTKPQFDNDCNKFDYPSVTQIHDTVVAKGVTLFSMIGRDPHVDALPAWQWVNTGLLEQPASFCRRISNDSSDFAKSLVEMLKAFKKEQDCVVVPTTTTAPTTATTPTTTTTTATTTATTVTIPSTTTATPTTIATPSLMLSTLDATASEHECTCHNHGNCTCHHHCGCHCGCGCGCGCHHVCSGGSEGAPMFVFNVPGGESIVDLSVLDIPSNFHGVITAYATAPAH